jgi:hypothetical protein
MGRRLQRAGGHGTELVTRRFFDVSVRFCLAYNNWTLRGFTIGRLLMTCISSKTVYIFTGIEFTTFLLLHKVTDVFQVTVLSSCIRDCMLRLDPICYGYALYAGPAGDQRANSAKNCSDLHMDQCCRSKSFSGFTNSPIQ